MVARKEGRQPAPVTTGDIWGDTQPLRQPPISQFTTTEPMDDEDRRRARADALACHSVENADRSI